MSDERLPVPHGDQAPTFGHRTTSPLVRRGLARLSAMADAERGSSEIALSEEDRPVLLWSFKGYGDKGQATKLTHPPMLALIPEAIPRELSERRQWVCWDLAQRGDKWGKPPISPITGNGSVLVPRRWEGIDGEIIFADSQVRGSVVDPRAWGSFEEAQTFVAQHGLPGVGFVLTEEDPFAVVDLDQCRNPETGELDTWAMQIIATLNSYTEVSQSGSGFHVLIRGTVPSFDPDYHQLRPEMYDRDWYVTCTGHHLAGTPSTVQDRQNELDTLLRDFAELTSDPLGTDHGEALALRAAATDLIVVRTWDGWFHALDSSTADRRWSFRPGDDASKNSYDEISYMLDVVGEELGSYRTRDDREQLPPDVIFLSHRGDTLHVLDTVHAWDLYERVRLSKSQGVNAAASHGPSKTQGHILLKYLVDEDDGALYRRAVALDSATGNECWRFEGSFISYSQLQSYGMIYIGFLDFDGEWIVALDATTGTERWSSYGGSTLITAVDGMIYSCDHYVGYRYYGSRDFGSDGAEGDIAALDAMSGEEIWNFRTRAFPILTDDTAYVVNRGVLYSLDIRTGRERWHLMIHDRIDNEDADPKAQSLAAELATTPTVQVVGDMIYASTGYTLFAFREGRMAGT